MRRVYLQNRLAAESLRTINAWQQRMEAPPETGDALWAVVDGAVIGEAGARILHQVYGPPVRPFDGTELADYEDLGILLWPVELMSARDELAALDRAVDESPCLSIVRTQGHVNALRHVLTWLAGAVTTDGMPLYLRIADSRVLSSLLGHLDANQRSVIRPAVREWVWPDRAGALTNLGAREPEDLQEATPATGAGLVLDDAQYAALLDDMEADMLHADLRRQLRDWEDPRTGAEIHSWMLDVLLRAKALGLKSSADHLAFADLALRIPGEFEGAPELGETWFKAKSGACTLSDAMRAWGTTELRAIERFKAHRP